MRIAPIEYDTDGVLLSPVGLPGMKSTIAPGGMITLEPGFYHRIKIREALDPAVARRRAQAAVEHIRSAGGQIMSATEYSTTIQRTHGVEIVYLVLDPQRPLTPLTAAQRAEAGAAIRQHGRRRAL